MKKWMLVVLIILGLVILFLWFPRSSKIKAETSVSTNARAFIRSFSDENSWVQWWPGKKGKDPKGFPEFTYNNIQYTILDKKSNAFVIRIGTKNRSFETLLEFIAIRPDSLLLSWNGKLKFPSDPIQRWNSPIQTSFIKRDMQSLLEEIKKFYSKESNIYGIEIRKEKVMDSILLSTFRVLPHPPQTGDVYQMVDELKAYARKFNALETGNPMLNVYTRDSAEYLTRVAIPVNKKLPTQGNISYKWMLGGGNILVTDVTGGPYQIKNALRELDHYVEDNKRTAPAIPFESMVRDRREEKDTSKWITRLYYPVM